MDDILEIARRSSDQAEVYTGANRTDAVTFDNGRLHEIESYRNSGVSLRIIRDGRLGFAYGGANGDPKDLVDHAVLSLAGEVEARYSFPKGLDVPALETHDPAIDDDSTRTIAEECRRVHDRLAELTAAEITVRAWKSVGRIELRNSAGADYAAPHTSFMLVATATYPGSGTGVSRWIHSRRFTEMSEAVIAELARLVNAGTSTVSPAGGRMKVLFMPRSMATLMWRLATGVSARSVHEGISPIAGRVGERVLDEKLTVYDDPRNPAHVMPRCFDDEGTVCDRFPLVTNGVLQGFYADLFYAEKLGIPPTGHGHRIGMWGGNSITLLPVPTLRHRTIEPGELSFAKLLSAMDRGIVLEGVLGMHSGNIPNGDYSVGVNPAFYVENGEIVGRVTEAMVAGNAYETLSEVVAVGNRLHREWNARYPALLCDNVSVVVK